MKALKNKDFQEKTSRATAGTAQIKITKNGYVRIQLPRDLFDGKQKCISFGANTPENLRKAKAKLLLIQRDIEYDEFDISLEKYSLNYQAGSASPQTDDTSIAIDKTDSFSQQNTVEQMLGEKFESEYFLRHPKNRKSQRTFQEHKKNITRAFKFKGSLDFYLTKQDIDKAIALTDAGTYLRKATVTSLRVFCKLFQFNYDFQGLTKGYKPKPRNIPTDEKIIEGWEKIKVEKKFNNPNYLGNGESWGWIYAVIATYGLRPHEVLAIDFEKSFQPPHYYLYINEYITQGTKTGSRMVPPIPREWVDLFDIAHPKTKKIKEYKEHYGTNMRKFADLLSERAREKGVGFKIYDLRHGYAIRGHELEYKIDAMSRWMGHCITEHTKTYQKYLQEKTHFIAYENGLERLENKKDIKPCELAYVELEAEVNKAQEYIFELESKIKDFYSQRSKIHL